MIQSPYALKEEELRHAVDDKCQVSLLIKEWQLIISCKSFKKFQLSLINVLDVGFPSVNNSLKSRHFGVIVAPLGSLSNKDGDENVTWKLNSRTSFLLFSLILFHSIWQVLGIFLELNSKELYLSSEKENCCLVFTSFIIRETRKSHVVVQQRQRSVLKRAMHVQSCHFANQTYCCCRSRCRRRRGFLSSPLSKDNLSLYNRQRIPIHIVKSEVKYLGQFAILRKPIRSGSVISSLSLLLNSTTL